jgi:polysaccharide biosynthesis protein PslA
MSLVGEQESNLNFKSDYLKKENGKAFSYKSFNILNKRHASRDFQILIKRIFDIVFSLATILFLAPVFLTIAVIIKLDSPGPVLFSQTRWGQNQKKIKILKFRTMYSHLCDDSGVQQTTVSDNRVTRFGAYLRKTNLDEIPQFFNILMGEMSVIGPRCHAVGMLASGMLYEELVENYHIRHVMKPGLTGLAQCRGLRGPTDRTSKARARIASDIYYVNNFSLLLDAKIFLATLKYEFFGGSGF